VNIYCTDNSQHRINTNETAVTKINLKNNSVFFVAKFSQLCYSSTMNYKWNSLIIRAVPESSTLANPTAVNSCRNLLPASLVYTFWQRFCVTNAQENRKDMQLTTLVISAYNQQPRSTQPGHPSLGRHNEYQPNGSDAVWFICGWEIKLCDHLVITGHI